MPTRSELREWTEAMERIRDAKSVQEVACIADEYLQDVNPKLELFHRMITRASLEKTNKLKPTNL